MDRRERNTSFSAAMIAAQQGLKAEMWSALPGIIESFDPVKMTAVVQPTIQALWRDPLGNETWQTMPLCLDCPVLYPGGGGVTLTFPLQNGDEVLLVFASRCIDAWWQSGGIGVQAELRMHDLSDGFCIPGPRSQPRVLPGGVAMDAIQLRSDDGEAFVEVKTGGFHNINVVTQGEVVVFAAQAEITASLVTINGDVKINGNLEVAGGDIKTDEVNSYNNHRHGGVDTGGGSTQGPKD